MLAAALDNGGPVAIPTGIRLTEPRLSDPPPGFPNGVFARRSVQPPRWRTVTSVFLLLINSEMHVGVAGNRDPFSLSHREDNSCAQLDRFLPEPV